ncbi:MAG: hypothetical protein OXF95_00020 [Rhodobacteraceae bacterium]|nr:hypothetical protein [Paracoccaceae bacterium]
MSVYAVFLSEPNEKSWNDLKAKYPSRNFILSENMAFVAPEDVTLTSDIMEVVGVGKDTDQLGIVFELDSYNGFHRGELWEWLGKFK